MPKRASVLILVLSFALAAPALAAPSVLILDESDCPKDKVQRNAVGDFDADPGFFRSKLISSQDEYHPDITLLPIKSALDLNLAANLPPIPVELDLPVKLSEGSATPPEPIKKNGVYYTYYELLRKVSSRPDAQSGRLHKQLGDILLEYAYIAKDNGRGTVGMKRLLNSWIEYRRALAIDPKDSSVRAKLLTIADAAVKIKPSACNYLALGSANYLNGNFEQTNDCIKSAEKCDPNYPGIGQVQDLIKKHLEP